MVIEHFTNGDPAPVYRRARDRGRLAPEGLSYVASWVDTNLDRCYQLMETDDPRLLDEWTAQWSDIVDFEIQHTVSPHAAERRRVRRRPHGHERQARSTPKSRRGSARNLLEKGVPLGRCG
jgi:hypothetical protein